MPKLNEPLNSLIGRSDEKLEHELWESVPGFSDYEISDLGRVRSYIGVGRGGRFRRKDPKLLSPYDNGEGYLKTDLRQDGQRHSIGVHILVADRFIPNFESKLEVNHIDGNKANNAWTNLEWNTRQENQDHAIRTGLLKPTNYVSWHGTAKKWQARITHNKVRHDLGRYNTIKEAEDAVNTFRRNIATA